MRLGLIVLVVAMLLAWGATDAGAQQWVTNATCDSVLIEGVFYPRVSFEIQDCATLGSAGHMTACRLASTGPEDTCGIVSAAGPEKWDAQMATDGACALWWPYDDAPTLLPGESLAGFQLVLTAGHSCCFEFSFWNVFGEPLAYETVCFECDRAVPVIDRTWGALKALYR
jgi:hypothetical protein